jgi:hypothetical protein
MSVVSTVLCAHALARAERRLPAWHGTSLVHLTASREALGAAAARGWGASVPVDEAYAGPWADSPFAVAPRGPASGGASPLERGAAPAVAGGGNPAADAARSADAVLGRLGRLGLLASVVVPAMGLTSGGGDKGVTARVGVTKMCGGYGLVVAGRF